MKFFWIILIIIVLGFVGWLYLKQTDNQKDVEATGDQIELKKNNLDYVLWNNPDAVTEDTLYAYKLYPDNDCHLMYVYENEAPAGRRIAKLRLCQDTIAKFYHLDTGLLIAQTAKCSIEFRYNFINKKEEITSDQKPCSGSLISVK